MAPPKTPERKYFVDEDGSIYDNTDGTFDAQEEIREQERINRLDLLGRFL